MAEIENKGMEEKINFEESIEKLEEIASKLEGGEISLDESLKLFEEGIKMLKACNAAIDNAEQKVNVLLSKGGDEMQEEAF